MLLAAMLILSGFSDTMAGGTGTAEEGLPLIGEMQQGDTVCHVVLENDTGLDFAEVSVKHGRQEEWPVNLLPEEEVFAAGEKQILFYDIREAEKAQADYYESGGAEPDEPLQTPYYCIRFTDGGENEYELHRFPFGDIEEGTIRLTDGTLWLEYRSSASGELVKTLWAEKAVAERKELNG